MLMKLTLNGINMEVIINENQYNNLISKKKLMAIQSLVDLTIANKYDFICKIVISPPNHYNPQCSAHVYFKDMSETSYAPGNYFRVRANIMDEVWRTIYEFTNETVSLYQNSC